MSDLRDLKIEGFGSSYGGEYNKVKLEGMTTIKDNIKCVSFVADGMCNLSGELVAEDIITEGTFKIKGNIKTKRMKMEGLANIELSVNADEIIAEGVIQCNELSADKITIDGVCKASKIFGESIVINSNFKVKVGLFNIFKNPNVSSADLIECTEFKADGLNADIIRASKVTLGKYCSVNLVEYSESIDIHPEAKVKDIIKL